MSTSSSKLSSFFASPNSAPSQASTECKAILFDVFGTVVNWRQSMNQAFEELFAAKNITTHSTDEVIERWISTYSDNMQLVSQGKRAFATVDTLNEQALIKILKDLELYDHFTEHERTSLWTVWHRLAAWPDSNAGIDALKTNAPVGTLSNGNVELLADLAAFNGICWDHLLSGELYQIYKPAPTVYLKAAKQLNLSPNEILLVASHKYDLQAAKACGYQTAYIYRPTEFKEERPEQAPIDGEFDYWANGIDELAQILYPKPFKGHAASI